MTISTPDATPGVPTIPTKTPSSSKVLVDVALKGLIPMAVDKALLTGDPLVIIIETPTRSWANAIQKVLRKRFPMADCEAFLEAKKTPLKSYEVLELASLFDGKAVIAVSQDPDGLVPEVLLRAADVKLTLKRPGPDEIARVISIVANKRVRRLAKDDIEGLDFDDLAAAIRPGPHAARCVKRLRRAAEKLATPQVATDIPSVDDLPLAAGVKDWAHRTLRAMKKLENGPRGACDVPFTLLYGPPGTGKTLIAAALARTAGWTFVSTSVGSWLSDSDGHLGGVTKAAADFFKVLRTSDSPVVGFIDEIDSLPNRAAMEQRDATWWTPIITKVLTEIDLVRTCGRPILLISATNRVWTLDGALVRPGRFGLHLEVPRPSTPAEFAALFRYYLGDRIGESEIERLVALGTFSGNFTPAGIREITQGAIADADDAGRDLTAADLEARILPKETRPIDEVRGAAIHEAGHAVVAYALGMKPAVSIVATGIAGGMTLASLRGHLNQKGIADMVTMTLAGRAADVRFGSGADAGARSDLQQASSMLAEAMLQDGMYDQLLVTLPGPGRLHELDDGMKAKIEEQLQAHFKRAMEIVRDEEESVWLLVHHLMKRRSLTSEEVAELLGGSSVAAGLPDPEAKP